MSFVSRVIQPTSRAVRSALCRCQTRPQLREYCWGRHNKNLPIWRRRSPFEEMFDRSLSMRMETPFRLMEKMMDEFRVPRWFMEPYGYTRASGKELQVTYNDRVFEIRLDTTHYAPEELNVKLAGDRLSISGKHQEKADEHGHISREFTRDLLVPENVNLETMESFHTEDGQLLIKAKVKGSEAIPERKIDIQKETPEEKPEKDN